HIVLDTTTCTVIPKLLNAHISHRLFLQPCLPLCTQLAMSNSLFSNSIPMNLVNEYRFKPRSELSIINLIQSEPPNWTGSIAFPKKRNGLIVQIASDFNPD
ncbi:hypothetical protein COCVIDRAFT_89377, partial [Bipolaris victoriae FI3]